MSTPSRSPDRRLELLVQTIGRKVVLQQLPDVIERLDRIEQAVEQIQQALGHPSGTLVDAKELAPELGVKPDWCRRHAVELGAVRMGDGPRPRLRFDPAVAKERFRRNGCG